MKKKTAFAAAILHQPDLLVLDEPFESVDPISQHRMKEILNKYLADGGSVIMSSHVLDTVQNICKKFILMNKGEIIKESTINALDGSLEDEFFNLVNDLNLAHEETLEEEDDEAED